MQILLRKFDVTLFLNVINNEVVSSVFNIEDVNFSNIRISLDFNKLGTKTFSFSGFNFQRN